MDKPIRKIGQSEFVIGFILLVCLGMSVQLWAASQWAGNFDSDEAIHGLLAHHILEGKLPIYFLGQGYLGCIESYIAASLMKVLGTGVFTIRISSLALFCIFLILHGFVVYKFWGSRTALISLFLLALPSWQILWWTFRPTSGLCPLFVFGTSALLLSHNKIFNGKYRRVRIFLIGIIFGLGVWIHPMIVYYILPIGTFYWLQMPEWSILRKRLAEFISAKINFSPNTLFFGLSLFAFLLIVVTFFTSGCKPQDLFVKLRILTLIILFGLISTTVLLLFFNSKRRKQLIGSSTLLMSGLTLGNFPLWGAWFFLGVVHSPRTVSSCPIQILDRANAVFGEILPSMWGLPFFSETFYLDVIHSSVWSKPLVNIVFWMIVLVNLVFFLGWFFWSERKLLWSLATMSPLPKASQGAAIFSLLFGVPLIVALLAGNTDIGISAMRYVVVSWQAGSAILAISMSHVFNSSKILARMLIGIWAIQIIFGNLFYVGNIWSQQKDWNSHMTISALEEFFNENQVEGGYADYWISYRVNFLTEERIIIAPYNGVDRYRPYTNKVRELPLQAFIFHVDSISTNTSEVEAMIDYMNTDFGFGVAKTEIIAKLPDMSFIKRQQVSHWDVWLFSAEGGKNESNYTGKENSSPRDYP
ncbi:hypothetical protein CEE37_01070 [candidate division LCP-89 bacterium B3_LCP]|uniref:Glycosyltransferase RgtA/B/C/D-like domain-containing protein n=1 Tax=candidate division LCP-89 bacterium B3_LCP TaxID=2012998 RepID=A0A532V529_UNCL8|nr:MAG: hypothetical protein CEE37_01070 [candidate division LCP-89 bacterium B3_LCP]